jgi:hypothetical protein
VSELTPEEIDFLQGFVKGLGFSYLGCSSGEITGRNLMHMSGWGSILSDLANRLSPRIDAILSVAERLGPQVERLRDLADRQELKALTTNDVNFEIGAMKSHVDQAVTQINEALQSVQSVLDELKEQKELLEIARVADTDPLYGTM